MAAHDDDLIRPFPAADLADDVGGISIGQEPGVHFQADTNLRAAVLHPLQALRVLDGDGGAGNLRHPFRVAQSAGVGRAQAGWADGADERGDGAKLRRPRWPRASILHGFGIRGEGNVEENDLAAHARAGSIELVERPHDQHLGFDTFGWRADAVAEAEHDEARSEGCRDFDAFLAANPVRNFHRFGPDVVEPILLHLGDRPLDRALQRLRTAEPMSERVSEEREAFPREWAGLCLCDQA